MSLNVPAPIAAHVAAENEDDAVAPGHCLAENDKDGTTAVTSRLTGTFPGRPVDVRLVFERHGNRIIPLEIYG